MDSPSSSRSSPITSGGRNLITLPNVPQVSETKPGTLDPDPATTAAVVKACHRAGLVALTCGTFGNVIRFLPPLVIGEDLLNEGLSILEDAFAAV